MVQLVVPMGEARRGYSMGILRFLASLGMTVEGERPSMSSEGLTR